MHRNNSWNITSNFSANFLPNFWVLCPMRRIPECCNQSYSQHCYPTLPINIAICLFVIILICGQGLSPLNSTIVCNFKNNACHLLHNRYVADRVLYSLAVLVKAHKQQYIQVQLYSVTSKLFKYIFLPILKNIFEFVISSN